MNCTVLKHRLADLRAAECVNDLVAGNPRILNHTVEQQFALNICNGFSLIFCANHKNNPRNTNQIVNWSKVNRIKILLIGKNND